MVHRALQKLALAVVTAPFLSGVAANDGLSLEAMTASLQSNNGREIARQAQPLWHIGLECGNWPCYPDFATQGPNQDQTPPAWRFTWPRFDSSQSGGPGKCPYPGSGGSDSAPIPTYYTVTKCDGAGEAEFRVTYSIFFAKDGVAGSAFGKEFGHDYDWEDSTVIWRRDATDKMYYRDEILLERHGARVAMTWDRITSTFNNDSDIAQDNNKKRNHAKLYIGTSKHAIFQQRRRDNERGVCTFFADINAIQDDDINDAVRADKWYYMADGDTLIDAGNNTAYGQKLQKYDYGGLSVPGKLQSGVCDLWTVRAKNSPAASGSR